MKRSASAAESERESKMTTGNGNNSNEKELNEKDSNEKDSNAKKKDMLELPSELRLGYIGKLLFCDALGEKLPKHLDLLDIFFPGLIVSEEAASLVLKNEAFFNDDDLLIHAERKNGSFYVGSSTRVSQIIARLIGTARAGHEKERQTAARIRSAIADYLTLQHYPVAVLLEHWTGILDTLPEDALIHFSDLLSAYIDRIIDHHTNHPREAEAEESPIKKDVFGSYKVRLVNAWNTDLSYAFAWLLLGSLLRNEVSRLVLRYTCDFCFFDEAASMTGDDVHTEYFYEGDDLDKRFPGIEWFCDRCEDRLDQQPGFDDHLRIWKCKKCGYENQIDISQIYDSTEDYKEHREPVSPDAFYQALKRRTDEISP